MATKNELVKITKTSAVMTLDNIGAVTMPADTGRNVKAILGAMEVGNKANLTMCKSLARIKATESYKEVYNADGVNVSPTFGEFAETVLNMSKGGASNYATVGEVFGPFLESGWKYGHFVLMLKLRKILDENGEPLDGASINAMLEEHGATPEWSTRKLDELIKNLLCDGEENEDGEEEEDSESEEDGKEDEDNTVSLTTAFKVIRASAEKSGKWEKLQKRIIDLEKELEGGE